MIERKILIGLITSTEFIQETFEIINIRSFKSNMAKRLVQWVLEYYNEYERAPGLDIENIYYQKLKEGLPKEIAEEIEEDILPSLSTEFSESEMDITYLVDITKTFFQHQHLDQFSETIQKLLKDGKVDEAEKSVYDFKPVIVDEDTSLDLSSDKVKEVIAKAFAENKDYLIQYDGALGKFINHQLIRGGFVAFMGPEKRGKTWWLMDMAIKGVKNGHNVMFIQAGDMSKEQQLRRIAIHLTGKSDMEIYTGEMFEPVVDCKYNQCNTCMKVERDCDFGIFPELNEKSIQEVSVGDLKNAFDDFPRYKSCTGCDEFNRRAFGVPWLQKITIDGVLTEDMATKYLQRFFGKRINKLILDSYPNNTLTVRHIKNLIKISKRKKGISPDIIIVDYADLLVPDSKIEFRHQQNEIWKGLRGITQEFECLLVTATQTDAKSYDKTTLGLGNFSEDKRKYAHVTAMYGLNQDPQGREKEIGILRLNELVLREGMFSSEKVVHVLQNLRRGRPVIGSYF